MWHVQGRIWQSVSGETSELSQSLSVLHEAVSVNQINQCVCVCLIKAIFLHHGEKSTFLM